MSILKSGEPSIINNHKVNKFFYEMLAELTIKILEKNNTNADLVKKFTLNHQYLLDKN